MRYSAILECDNFASISAKFNSVDGSDCSFPFDSGMVYHPSENSHHSADSLNEVIIELFFVTQSTLSNSRIFLPSAVLFSGRLH